MGGGGGGGGGSKEKIFQMLFCYLILEQELWFHEIQIKLVFTNFAFFLKSIHLFTNISYFKNESVLFWMARILR